MFCIKYPALTVPCNGTVYKIEEKFTTMGAELDTNKIRELFFIRRSTVYIM
jgi:hypothetical protein